MAGRDLGSAEDQMAENIVLEKQPVQRRTQCVLGDSWGGF